MTLNNLTPNLNPKETLITYLVLLTIWIILSKLLYFFLTRRIVKKPALKQISLILLILGGSIIIINSNIHPLSKYLVKNYQINPSPVHIEQQENRQLLIYWKTQKPTVGYIKYGTHANKLWYADIPQNQQPSQIHSAILNINPHSNIWITIRSNGRQFNQNGHPILIWKNGEIASFSNQKPTKSNLLNKLLFFRSNTQPLLSPN